MWADIKGTDSATLRRLKIKICVFTKIEQTYLRFFDHISIRNNGIEKVNGERRENEPIWEPADTLEIDYLLLQKNNVAVGRMAHRSENLY